MCMQLGHKMVDPYPALTPLVGQHPKGKVDEQMPGVSLDLSASVVLGKKKISAPRTGFLFTHKGYSGPAILDLSHHFVRSTQHSLAAPMDKSVETPPKLVVQWSKKTTDEWYSGFKSLDNRATLALNVMKQEVPARLAMSLYDGVVRMPKKCANLTRKEVTKLSEILGAFELSVTGHQGYVCPVLVVMLGFCTSFAFQAASTACVVAVSGSSHAAVCVQV